MTTTEVGRWYPNQPPKLDGETDDEYTDRLTGADSTGRRPYDHSRNRQCSIGWHEECSDRLNAGDCGCPCHEERRDAWLLVCDWNRRYPEGTPVTLPAAADEPPTRTTGPARLERIVNRTDSWPVVPLEGFDRPVRMSWLKPEAAS
jgi:hypothetical protein